MARENRPVGKNQAAAHLVASTGKKGHWAAAADSRKLLGKYKINVNDAANGVPLGHPRPHNLTHTRKFQKQVNERLHQVEKRMKESGRGQKATRRALRAELRKIGREL